MANQQGDRSVAAGQRPPGVLTARPAAQKPGDGSGAVLRPGLQPIGPGPNGEGLLYVPKSYRSDAPAPLVLMLHGAGGDAANGLVPLQHLADSEGLVLLAPGSREATWDVIVGEYGADVNFIDDLLAHAFRLCWVDPAHIAIEGFSDGASYALSLGVSNGDLFTDIIAFSPGFFRPARQEGAPRIFISHGTRDSVLPINQCSRRIAPQLQDAGYDVTYKEFAGGHTVPPEIASEAVSWFKKS
ncbi:MAG: alpha/beta hydrolase [Gemmatimonadaceae bacterium]